MTMTTVRLSMVGEKVRDGDRVDLSGYLPVLVGSNAISKAVALDMLSPD